MKISKKSLSLIIVLFFCVGIGSYYWVQQKQKEKSLQEYLIKSRVSVDRVSSAFDRFHTTVIRTLVKIVENYQYSGRPKINITSDLQLVNSDALEVSDTVNRWSKIQPPADFISSHNSYLEYFKSIKIILDSTKSTLDIYDKTPENKISFSQNLSYIEFLARDAVKSFDNAKTARDEDLMRLRIK